MQHKGDLLCHGRVEQKKEKKFWRILHPNSLITLTLLTSSFYFSPYSTSTGAGRARENGGLSPRPCEAGRGAFSPCFEGIIYDVDDVKTCQP